MLKVNPELAGEIKKLRAKAKVTQAKLAVLCECTQAYIGQLELGQKGFLLASPMGTRISEALGVPLGHWVPFTADGVYFGRFAEQELMLPVRGYAMARAEPEPAPLEAGTLLDYRAGLPEDCFALRVGTSAFVRFGIHRDDHIVVAPASSPREGTLVILRDGESLTVKGYRSGKFWTCRKRLLEVPVRERRVRTRKKPVVLGIVVKVIGERPFVYR